MTLTGSLPFVPSLPKLSGLTGKHFMQLLELMLDCAAVDRTVSRDVCDLYHGFARRRGHDHPRGAQKARHPVCDKAYFLS